MSMNIHPSFGVAEIKDVWKFRRGSLRGGGEGWGVGWRDSHQAANVSSCLCRHFSKLDRREAPTLCRTAPPDSRATVCLDGCLLHASRGGRGGAGGGVLVLKRTYGDSLCDHNEWLYAIMTSGGVLAAMQDTLSPTGSNLESSVLPKEPGSEPPILLSSIRPLDQLSHGRLVHQSRRRKLPSYLRSVLPRTDAARSRRLKKGIHFPARAPDDRRLVLSCFPNKYI